MIPRDGCDTFDVNASKTLVPGFTSAAAVAEFAAAIALNKFPVLIHFDLNDPLFGNAGCLRSARQRNDRDLGGHTRRIQLGVKVCSTMRTALVPSPRFHLGGFGCTFTRRTESHRVRGRSQESACFAYRWILRRTLDRRFAKSLSSTWFARRPALIQNQISSQSRVEFG